MKNIRKYFGISIMLIFGGCAAQTPVVPSAAGIAPKPSTIFVASRVMSEELLDRKSRGALEILQGILVGPWCVKNGVVKGRQIALAGLSPTTEHIEVVLFGLCFEDPKKLEVLTHGYRVEWLEGRGMTRYSFRVINPAGEELLILWGKHWMVETKSAEYYAPFSNRMLRWDVVEKGSRALWGAADEAEKSLCNLNVLSRTYPGHALCSMFPAENVINIAIIEQIDDEEFSFKCPDPTTLPPENRIFENCAEYSVFKVLAHYGRNGNDAFRHVASRANARGALQFTERTYYRVVRAFPEAELNPSFEEGTKDLVNIVKAALCLFDLEMSGMPRGAQEAFQHDPRLAGIYPAAAYNGGLGRALCLFRGDRKTRKCRASRAGWRETTGYIAKYQGIWYIIDNLKERIKSK